MLLTAPLVAAAAILIRLGSPGPVLYSQTRVGRFGQSFKIWKLRSMRMGAERDGVQWASKNDGRVTRIGRNLRLTRLDEVPQFYNVLRGEMSIIGPRPERPEIVEDLAKEIPFYKHRHILRPGITGWAQINYPYGASKDDALNKLEYDLYYIKHASILLDLQVLLRTIGVVMKGAR
jgi:lipopolysaccharide/colanic/teichoic acid biosynthesis glycosyltransferase